MSKCHLEFWLGYRLQWNRGFRVRLSEGTKDVFGL